MKSGYEIILRNASQEVAYVEDCLSDLRTETETRKLWRAWSGILDHYVKAVSAMRRATLEGPSKRWADALLSEQRDNDFLNYAFQSRDHANHVFEQVRTVQPRSVNLAPLVSVSGDANIILKDNFQIDKDGTAHKLPEGQLLVKDGRYAGGSIMKSEVSEFEHFVLLGEVKTRSGVYPLPNPESDRASQAIEIGAYVLEWLQLKLEEAIRLAAEEDRKTKAR